MRPILGDTYDELQLANATRPAILLEVYWTGLANPPLKYSDQNINVNSSGVPEIPGYIIRISSLSSMMQHNQRGISGSLQVTLADPDGELKVLWDGYDIHKVPVAVFQTFSNDLTLKGFLFQGEITTPLTYDDANKTLTFTITASIELNEYGFSAEQGYFNDLAPEAVDKAWPLCFGSPVNVPAQKITAQVKGESLTTYGLVSHNDVETILVLAQEYVKQRLKYETYQSRDDGFRYTEPEAWTPEQLAKIALEYSNAEIRYRETMRKLYKSTGQNLDAFYQALEDYVNMQSLLNQVNAELALYESELNELNKRLTAKQQLYAQFVVMETAWSAVNNPYTYLKDSVAADIGNIQGSITQLTTRQEPLLLLKDSYADQLLTNYATFEAARREVMKFNLDSFNVANGKKFPQNTRIRVKVNNLILYGTMSGNTFTVIEKDMATYRHVKFGTRINSYFNEFVVADSKYNLKNMYCLIRTPWDTTFPNCVVYVTEQFGTRCLFQPMIFRDNNGTLEPILMGDSIYDGSEHEITEVSPIFKPIWYNFVDRTVAPMMTGLIPDLQAKNWSMNLGDAVVKYDEDYQDVYVANILESDQVYSVSAYRTVNNIKKLTPIPSSYYTIDLNQTFGDLTCTTISFRTPLTDREDEYWDNDTIYVTLRSSVGPNIADIIEHLALTYTDLTVDAGTFAAVEAAMVNYPANFALLQRGNVLDLIEEIAWQSRCVTYIRNGVIYLKYLSDQGTPVGSVGTPDIVADSIRIMYSETDNLCTKMIATWQPSYDKQPNKIILRNNIGRYGKIEQHFEFFIYNNEELVLKSATFWLIRYSSTWKRISFETPIHKLPWEAYDTVDVDIPVLFDGTVVCMVEETNYDPDNMRISMTIWTPIRAGESGEYELAYPANVATSVLYPTETDRYAGGSTDGHIVNSGGNYSYADRAGDVGTSILSDLDDSLPTIVAEDYGEVDTLLTPVVSKPTSAEINLNIDTTKLVDPRTGLSAPLSDLVKLLSRKAEGETEFVTHAAISTEALFVGPTQEAGPLLMEHDGEDFRAFDPLLGHE